MTHLNDFDIDRSGFDSSRMDIMATFFGLEMERQLSRQMYEHSLDMQAAEAKFERYLKEEKDRIAADKDAADQRIKEFEAAENLWKKTLNEEKVKAAEYKKEAEQKVDQLAHAVNSLQRCLKVLERMVALNDMENLKEEMRSLQVKVSKDKEHQAELEAKTDNERKIIRNNFFVRAARRPDIKILVIGPSGTGKSSLIQLVTGDQNIEVGHSVKSETPEIHLAHCFEADGCIITFVDTPSFEDSCGGMTNTKTLEKIAAFLEVDYEAGGRLNGIIYLHRITDARMSGVSARVLRVFKKLVGSDSLKNVVVVTTRWDMIEKRDETMILARERDLTTNPAKFQPLIAEKARFLRRDNSIESARRIMEQFLKYDPVTLRIQTEMAEGMTWRETAAGQEVDAYNNNLIERKQVITEVIQMELSKKIYKG